MSYCKECGTQLPENSKFCPQCGTKVSLEAQASTDKQELITEELENVEEQEAVEEKQESKNIDNTSTQSITKMDTRSRIIVFGALGFIILFAIFSTIISYISEDEPPSEDSKETQSLVDNNKQNGSKNNPYVLQADTWHSKHCAGTSNDEYIGEWVKVSGTVLSISDYGSLKGYYLSGGPGAGLVCWVDGDSISAQYGQQIEYVGKVTVEDSKQIEISEGEIKKASWPTKKAKSPITISEWEWTRDSLGGVEWNFKLTNNTDKIVKYVTLEWYCYNAVGDLVYDEITRNSKYSIKYTGPLEAGETSELLRNTSLFYSNSYNSSKLSKFIVEFTDGTIIYVHDQGYSDIINK